MIVGPAGAQASSPIAVPNVLRFSKKFFKCLFLNDIFISNDLPFRQFLANSSPMPGLVKRIPLVLVALIPYSQEAVAYPASKSTSVRPTTLVARRRSSSTRCSSARLAWLSRTVRGPAP